MKNAKTVNSESLKKQAKINCQCDCACGEEEVKGAAFNCQCDCACEQ